MESEVPLRCLPTPDFDTLDAEIFLFSGGYKNNYDSTTSGQHASVEAAVPVDFRSGIINSRGKEKANNSPPPVEKPVGVSVSFVINKVEKNGPLSFNLTPDLPFTFNGQKIDKVNIRGNKIKVLFQEDELLAGKTMTISKIQPGSNGILTIDEVRQKNAELAQEENSFTHLVNELTNIIKKNNQEVCPKASKLGLNLPTIPLDTLKYFEEKFFIELDDKLPLTDPANQQIIASNEAIRRKKRESIKANIYKIYNKNLKKLEDYHKEKPSSSDLEKLKSRAIETINKVLTDKDNLQNIDLFTLESGKYLEWEEDLTKLKEKNEVTAYLENFLEVLRKFVAQEREDSKSRPNSNEKIEISEIDKSPSLAEARNIAKKLIRKLFIKYNVRAEDMEII
nr:5880_t:CDS:2 [Entrophospora candida]